MTRKDFLSSIGGLCASGTILSMFPWLEGCSEKEQKAIASEKARLAIIGTGSRGQYHIANLLLEDAAQIVALCDDFQPHLDAAAAMCPEAKLYNDYRKLLEDSAVQGVLICTPLFLHAQMILDSLAAGKHVFCEKALAHSIEECKQVYDVWKESGKVLLVGQQRLFDPKYIKAMELVQNGAIGEVVGIRNYWYRNNDWLRPLPENAPAEPAGSPFPDLQHRINWRLYDKYSKGLMTELACHQIQNGSWAMGSMQPLSVMGSGNIRHWKDDREVFDNLAVIYQYPNGTQMTFESIISNKHFGMGEFILGSEGTIDLVSGTLYTDEPRQKSGIAQFLKQIEMGIIRNSVFAGTSWNQESGTSDLGTKFAGDVVVNSGASTVGALADGSVELMHADCHAVITGNQPRNVME